MGKFNLGNVKTGVKLQAAFLVVVILMAVTLPSPSGGRAGDEGTQWQAQSFERHLGRCQELSQAVQG